MTTDITSDAIEPPPFDSLVHDLKELRRKGITRLRELDLPAMHRASIAAGYLEPGKAPEPAATEQLLRDAVGGLGGGAFQESAEALLGLAQGMRGRPTSQLRDAAAARYDPDMHRDTFRTRHEPRLIREIAEGVIRRAHDFRMRLSRINLERRAPVSTRLAVRWLDLFKSYYRIWSPISGLYDDLEAYYSTVREVKPPAWWGTDSGGNTWDPQAQADGYAEYALFHFSEFLRELRQFELGMGGLWISPDQEAEQLLANATYRIHWETNFNERDLSVVRIAHDEAGGELHRFLAALKAEPLGRRLIQDWMQWVRTCECQTLESPREGCRPHQVVRQCRLYVRLVDTEWERVADWYRVEPDAVRMVEPVELYSQRHGHRPDLGTSTSHNDDKT